jgi:hypothetical protein
MKWLAKIFTGSNPIKDLGETIDALSTSGEERASLRQQALRTMIDAQARVIAAEAKAGGLAAQWRPILMLTFGGILVWAVVAETFGFPSPQVTLNPELWDLLKLGIGGYVGGRSVEKVVSTIAAKTKKKRD